MDAVRNPTAAQEWKLHWTLVLAAAIGFSYSAVVTYSIGLFIDPLTSEFGWGRSDVSAGLSLAALLSVPLAPLLGIMIDRWGSRRLALWGTVFTAICTVGFSFANGSMSQWLLLWVAYAVLSVGVNSTVWAAAISGVFTTGRGLALGFTLSGAALAQVIAPPLTQWLIEAYGWRMAFVILGLGWGAPGLIFCFFFLYDAHDHRKQSARRGDAVASIPLQGMTLKEATRSVPLLRVGVATLIMMVLTIAVIVHQVPILTETGISRQQAAFLASLTGIAGIAGKLVSGYLMDRMDAGLVSSLTMGIAALAFVMLLVPGISLGAMILAMIVLGYSNGCKYQICAYQTSRYAGMRNFGKIFGVMSCLVALGAGLGPYLAGVVYDYFGSYRPLLMVGVPASLLSGVLLFRLGPYPNWQAGETAPIAAEQPLSDDVAVSKGGAAA